MAVRAWGHLFIQAAQPAEDPVQVGSLWVDTSGTATLKVCTSISPYTFVEITGGGGASALADLTDVNLSGLADKDLLTWNAGTSKWDRTDFPSVAKLTIRDAGSAATHALDFASQGIGFYTQADELLMAFGGTVRMRWQNVGMQLMGQGGSSSARLIFGAFDGDIILWEEDSNGLKVAGNALNKGANLNVPGIGSEHGEGCYIKSLSEELTIAAAANTDTAIQFPAGCMALGVSVRVTTLIPTAATFDVGVAGATTRYGSGILVAATTTNASCGTTAPDIYATATSVRVTPSLSPIAATGKVRITIHFVQLTAPTS